MTLSEYLIEAVANRTTGKYYIPDADWQSILKWLKLKGFTGYGFDARDLEKHLHTKGNTYMVGNDTNGRRDIPNCVSVHTRGVHEIVFWFDLENGSVYNVELNDGTYIPFEEAIDLIKKSL
jgi:hypothetical protein